MVIKIIKSSNKSSEGGEEAFPKGEPPKAKKVTAVTLDPSKVVVPTFENPAQPKPKKFRKLLNASTAVRAEHSKFTEGTIGDILSTGNLGKGDSPEMYHQGSIGEGKRTRATPEGAEFRRKQVHRLLLRGVPRVTIAEYLGVGLETIHSDAKIITHEMRKELREFDYTVYIGSSIAFFEECRNIALRLATDTTEKSNGVKMSAIRTAIEAEKAKHDFFSKVGLFRLVPPNEPLHSINTGRTGRYSDETDINNFMQLIAKAATGGIELPPLPAPADDIGGGLDGEL